MRLPVPSRVASVGRKQSGQHPPARRRSEASEPEPAAAVARVIEHTAPCHLVRVRVRVRVRVGVRVKVRLGVRVRVGA